MHRGKQSNPENTWNQSECTELTKHTKDREVRTSSITLSVVGGSDGRSGDDHVEKGNPCADLDEGTLGVKGGPGINTLGDVAGRVHISRETSEGVGPDDSDKCDHGSTGMTELGLTEEGDHGRERLGVAKLLFRKDHDDDDDDEQQQRGQQQQHQQQQQQQQEQSTMMMYG